MDRPRVPLHRLLRRHWCPHDFEVLGEVAAALGGLIGGAIAALAAFVGVKTTLEGQAASDAERRDRAIAAVRLALHTEVGMIALVCIKEFEDWRDLRSGAQKDPRTARLPPLTIYNSVCSNVGQLTREEIVPLIKLASTLHNIEIVAGRLAAQGTSQTRHEQQTIAMHLFDACHYAADFCEAVPADARIDQGLTKRLREAYTAFSAPS